MKLIDKKSSVVNIKEMQDGDIAIIINWQNQKEFNNRIIQRYDDNIISLGMPYGESWAEVLKLECEYLNIQVEILPKGTVLEI